MDFKLEIEFSKTEILKEVDLLKTQIDELRPLPDDVEGRVMQKLRLDWNYHSNAIEGNRLNYGETVAFLMEGITAKGKPLKDHLDIRGHNEAINFLLSIVKDTRPLSETDIRNLHEMILVEPYDVKAETEDGLPTTKRITPGEYKLLPNHVKTSTGEIHYYASPEETPAKMQELMEWYSEALQNKALHPVVIAALFHHKFVEIHPFDDGNGRLSRILMNLIIMQHGYTPVIIKNDDRQNYYSLLSRADNGDEWPFVEYIAEHLIGSLQLYLKAAKGGDIDEDEDIDKEIALFRMELQNKVIPQKKASNDDIHKAILNVIIPFIEKLSKKISVFKDFFEFVVEKVEIRSKRFGKVNKKSLTDPSYNIKEEIEYAIMLDKRIDSILLQIELIGFKNADNVFDVSEELHFTFDDREYSIDNASWDIQVFKFYDENLTLTDQNLIIKHVIKDFKYLIEEKFKE